uniref:Ig-like domain-containing protein n=1 Tax=Astyanax mexicanus TaxID=7994 RepID=A0A3B1K850_ASTMX
MVSFLHVSILLLTVFSAPLSAQSRVFMTARVGSLVVLPCEWRDTLSPSPHIEWITFSGTVFERLGEEHYEGEGYEDRVDVPEDKLKKGNCSLELKEVKAEDAGVYESYLLVNRVKRALSSKRVFIQSVELSVDESPESSQHAEANLQLGATDDATVNCPSLKITGILLIVWLFFF